MIPEEAVEAMMDAAQDSGFVLKRSLAHDWLESAAPYIIKEWVKSTTRADFPKDPHG